LRVRIPPPALLVITRHAESERNVAKRGHPFFPDADAAAPFRGRSDAATALTEAGRAAARALGLALRERFDAFDLIIDSGVRRTIETTEGVLEAWSETERAGMTRMSDYLIRERDPGHAVNMTTDEAAQAFPWLQDYWKSEGPFYARPPGGENLADVAMRVQRFLESRRVAMADRRVLIVTHVRTAQLLRLTLEAPNPNEWRHQLPYEPLGNCGVLAYEPGPDGSLVPRVGTASP